MISMTYGFAFYGNSIVSIRVTQDLLEHLDCVGCLIRDRAPHFKALDRLHIDVEHQVVNAAARYTW